MDSSNLRLEFNTSAIQQLLVAPGVVADLQDRARRIASAAGPGMEVKFSSPHTRARVAVVTATHEAMKAEAQNRALTRAVASGR